MENYRDYISIGLFLVSMAFFFGVIIWNERKVKPPNVDPEIRRRYITAENLPIAMYGGLAGMYLLFEKHNWLGLVILIGAFVGCVVSIELQITWKRLHLLLFQATLLIAFFAICWLSK